MRYEGFAVSERGYQHILNNTICQDSSQYIQTKDCTVACVADGHGSKQYFRSNRGSQFASEIACRKVLEFIRTVSFPFENAESENKSVMQLIHSIITEWHIAVRNDVIKNPFTREELDKVPEKYFSEFDIFSEEKSGSYTDEERRKIIQDKNTHIPKTYGTTLIVFGVHENYAIGLHIGDGKCVALYKDGSMDEPVPWDENCHLNRCTSICDSNASEEFRYYIWHGERLPVAVFAGTDGIDDTFANMLHTFYRNVALDFLHNDFRDSVDIFQKKLADISKAGSHDDVSVAGIINISELYGIETKLKNITKLESVEKQQNQLIEKINELNFKLDKLRRISSNENTSEKTDAYEVKIKTLEKELESCKENLSLAEKNISNLKKIINEDEETLKESPVNDTEDIKDIEVTEITENTESAEIIENTESTESAETTDSTESAKITDSTESVEITDSTENAETTDSTESVETTDSTENSENSETDVTAEEWEDDDN